MRLPIQDIERFYRIWLALLRYVDEQFHIAANFSVGPGKGGLSVEELLQLRDTLWKHDEVRERFIRENPERLPAADLAVIDSWQYRLADSFTAVSTLQKYTILISHSAPAHVYGVLGLMSTIEETLPHPLPMYVKTVLLPFEGRIIYDSLVIPYSMLLGSGVRRGIKEEYRALREREGIITNLLPADHVISLTDQREAISARNRKILNAFRRELLQGTLSEQRVEKHTKTIEDFAQGILLEADPPRGILDLTPADLRAYIEMHPGKQPLTSFKRFLRFLLVTGRIDYDAEEDLSAFLRQMQPE